MFELAQLWQIALCCACGHRHSAGRHTHTGYRLATELLISDAAYNGTQTALHHAVQLVATARWDHCVCCSLSAVLSLHEAHDVVATVTSR